MDFVVAVNRLPRGFFVLFGKNREKSDLSGTDCGSDFDRERTRRMRNCLADKDEGVGLLAGAGRGAGKANEATGMAALAWGESAATTFGGSTMSWMPLFPSAAALALPPPGPELLFSVFESTPTALAKPVLGFLSFALLRERKTA